MMAPVESASAPAPSTSMYYLGKKSEVEEAEKAFNLLGVTMLFRWRKPLRRLGPWSV